jgi:hypothetical protein
MIRHAKLTSNDAFERKDFQFSSSYKFLNYIATLWTTNRASNSKVNINEASSDAQATESQVNSVPNQKMKKDRLSDIKQLTETSNKGRSLSNHTKHDDLN